MQGWLSEPRLLGGRSIGWKKTRNSLKNRTSLSVYANRVKLVSVTNLADAYRIALPKKEL